MNLTHEQIDKMEAGREMDAKIAEHVTKLQGIGRVYLTKGIDCVYNAWSDKPDEGNLYVSIPHYSTETVDAMRVLEHINNNVKITLYEPNDTPLEYIDMQWYGGKWNVVLAFTANDEERFGGTDKELSTAICRAALKAVINE